MKGFSPAILGSPVARMLGKMPKTLVESSKTFDGCLLPISVVGNSPDGVSLPSLGGDSSQVGDPSFQEH